MISGLTVINSHPLALAILLNDGTYVRVGSGESLYFNDNNVELLPDHLLERCKDGVLDVGLDTGCKPTDEPKPVKIKPKNFGFRKMYFRKRGE